MRQQLAKFQTNSPYFPVIPRNPYNRHLAPSIDSLVLNYHNSTWINFQDMLQYHDDQEYLKRQYKHSEFKNKIKLLGDYYRFHFEAPRFFMDGMGRIIQQNIQDKRQLEYNIVTRQMKNKDQQQQEDQFPLLSTNREHERSHEKLIKDVELSYYDFQMRNAQKRCQEVPALRKQQKTEKVESKQNRNCEKKHENVERAMYRVDSIKFKGNYLVFHQNKQIKQKESKPKLQLKYKKPKQDKKSGKMQAVKQEISKSKKVSKVNSTNNSVGSQCGLSRSKSKVHLNLFNSNKLSSINKQPLAQRQNQATNLMTRSCSRKQVALDRKDTINVLSRKGSKAELKFLNPNQIVKSTAVSKEKHIYELAQKKIKQNDAKPKKMFTKALQIKKKK